MVRRSCFLKNDGDGNANVGEDDNRTEEKKDLLVSKQKKSRRKNNPGCSPRIIVQKQRPVQGKTRQRRGLRIGILFETKKQPPRTRVKPPNLSFGHTLITQPITPLYGIIHVPSPIILGHVPQGGINTTLSRHGMRTRRKEFGHTSRFKTGFGQAHGSAQTGTAGTHHDGIVRVIDDGIISNQDGTRLDGAFVCQSSGSSGTTHEVSRKMGGQHGRIVLVVLVVGVVLLNCQWSESPQNDTVVMVVVVVSCFG